jgi:hypothetical protein
MLESLLSFAEAPTVGALEAKSTIEKGVINGKDIEIRRHKNEASKSAFGGQN